MVQLSYSRETERVWHAPDQLNPLHITTVPFTAVDLFASPFSATGDAVVNEARNSPIGSKMFESMIAICDGTRIW